MPTPLTPRLRPIAARPTRGIRADTFCPADLNACVQVYGPSLDPCWRCRSGWIDGGTPSHASTRRRRRRRKIAHRLNRVRLRPPMRVPVLRDFAAFEDHLQVTFGKMGLKIPPEWYDRPIAFKGNVTSLIGHDEPLHWPQYTQKLDYELELAAVVGLPARDVDVDEAARSYSRLHLAQRFLGPRYSAGRDGHEYRTLQRERLCLGLRPVDRDSR